MVGFLGGVVLLGIAEGCLISFVRSFVVGSSFGFTWRQIRLQPKASKSNSASI